MEELKTLHPKIHAGILNDRSNKKHRREMLNKNFKNIDLVIVNFYPFLEIAKKIEIQKKIIENIDIGGPSMVKSCCEEF